MCFLAGMVNKVPCSQLWNQPVTLFKFTGFHQSLSHEIWRIKHIEIKSRNNLSALISSSEATASIAIDKYFSGSVK